MRASMKTTRQQQLLKEIQSLKRRLERVEHKAATLQKSRVASPRIAFQRKYPQLSLNPQLLKLVGIDPPLNLEEEKEAISTAIRSRFETK